MNDYKEETFKNMTDAQIETGGEQVPRQELSPPKNTNSHNSHHSQQGVSNGGFPTNKSTQPKPFIKKN